MLGGSSSINGMVYIRGQAEDFDHWRQLGNTGWSFRGRAALFQALRAPDPRRRRVPWHRRPALRFRRRDKHPICEAFIDGAMSSAFRATTISTARSQEGVGYHQTTTRNGKRCSTAVGYLRPAMQRPNLRVITKALTEKIVFEGGRATGVAFRRDGRDLHRRAPRAKSFCAAARSTRRSY